METLQHAYAPEMVTERKRSLISRFFAWCETQEESRLLWLGIIVGGHGCVITPLTLLFIMLAGNPVIFWPFAIAAMTMALVVNLAALPARITIPIFLFSLLIDLFVIINCIAIGFPLIS
jgi:hypothetical protein